MESTTPPQPEQQPPAQPKKVKKPKPDAADYKILELVKAHPAPTTLHVVTSDNWLADAARDAGAIVEPSEGFRTRLDD